MSKTILIVEDDTFLQKAYQSKLSKHGFSVLIAADGKRALEIVESEEIALVILDLVMPNMDGFAVLENLKTSEKTKNLPVLVASNLGQIEDMEKAKKMGADDYIVKSNMSLDDVIKKVSGLLENGDSKPEKKNQEEAANLEPDKESTSSDENASKKAEETTNEELESEEDSKVKVTTESL